VASNLPLADQRHFRQTADSSVALSDDERDRKLCRRRPGGDVRVSRARTPVTGLDTDTGPGVGTPPGARPRSKIRGRPHRRAPCRATSTAGRPAACRVSDEREIEIGFAGMDRKLKPIATRGRPVVQISGGVEKRHWGFRVRDNGIGIAFEN
jgi:hypothetical protein